MNYNNEGLYCQVLGSIMECPSLLDGNGGKITLDDFPINNKIVTTVFSALKGLYAPGINNISADMIKIYCEQHATVYGTVFKRYNGSDFIDMCLENADPDNFNSFYNELKKESLMRDLKKNGYKVDKYDYDSVEDVTTTNYFMRLDEYQKASLDDIIHYAEKGLSDIRERHSIDLALHGQTAGDGIFDLLENLGQYSDTGMALRGELFNSIVRGARLGCMYVRSAGTGGGKSRSSVFDACNIAIPIRYHNDKGCFVFEKRDPQKVLFIVTEQTAPEIQSMMLAYISAIEENKIKNFLGLSIEEKERLRCAAHIISFYKDYFFIDEINDPNLHNVEDVIVKRTTVDEVRFVFYDYIFSSPSLMREFSNTGLREDR